MIKIARDLPVCGNAKDERLLPASYQELLGKRDQTNLLATVNSIKLEGATVESRDNIREKQEKISSLQSEKERLELLVKQQENQLRNLEEQLEIEIAQKEKFEEIIRTNLTTIVSSTELLKTYSYKLSQFKKKTHFARIELSAQYMLQMFNDIIFLGKAEAGKLEFTPILINALQFCQSLVEEFELNGNNKASLIFTHQCPLSSVWLDEKLMRHILNNLISNAIKYSPSGSMVNFELNCQDKWVIFKVQDSGIGIPKDDLQHLFESFYRANNVENIPGTGLGLAIVKKAVDLHGGTIEVDSEIGVGTTFTITIPISD